MTTSEAVRLSSQRCRSAQTDRRMELTSLLQGIGIEVGDDGLDAKHVLAELPREGQPMGLLEEVKETVIIHVGEVLRGLQNLRVVATKVKNDAAGTIRIDIPKKAFDRARPP